MKNYSAFALIFISFLALLIHKTGFLDDLYYQKNCLVLSNARILDIQNMQYTEGSFLLIKNESISGLTKEIPLDFSNCKNIDIKNKFVIPGLIDTHTHLLAGDKQRVRSWREALSMSADKPYMTRLFLGEKNAFSMLKAGFTTMRDLGNSGHFLDAKLNSLLNSRYGVKPHLLFSGPGISYQMSQISSSVYPQEYKVIDDHSDLGNLLTDYKKNGASWIKLYADSSNKSNLFNSEKFNNIIKMAHESGFKVAVHAENAKSERLALLSDADSIEHFYELPEQEEGLTFNSKPSIVLTHVNTVSCENLNFEPDCLDKLKTLKDRTDWLRKNNFSFVFGSDAVLDFTSKYDERGEASLDSLMSLSELGFSNTEILKSATLNASEMLSLKAGQISKDYQADLLVLNADPVENIKNLQKRFMVISGGKPYCQNEKECAL